MELKHIDIANLAISGANMRGKGNADLSNILPSVRARRVLVPLIVRQNGTPDTYEILAGKRRYQAALAVAQETGEGEALPCAVIEAGDDAAASSPTCSAMIAISPISRPSGTHSMRRSKPASRPIARLDGAMSSCCRRANRSIAGNMSVARSAKAARSISSPVRAAMSRSMKAM
jgi:ParB family chromosome partitioning protein